MKLYYSPGACSMASHLALNEAGLKFEAVPVNLQTHHYKGGDYYKVNPKGYVPALELDNGQILTEGVAIMQYAADQAKDANLIPAAGTFERYRCIEWLNFISTEVHKTWSPLWFDKTPEETKTTLKNNLAKRFDYLSGHLKEHPFLMGKNYTVADGYLFTILGWSHNTKVDLTKWPTLMGFIEKVKSRPATMTTMKAEGLIK